MSLEDQSTSYLVEEVFKQALEAHAGTTALTQNVQHFNTDETNQPYPLVSIKATLDEEDTAEIKYQGEAAEVYRVLIVSEWPLDSTSSIQVDKLARQCKLAIAGAGSVDALDEFAFFHIEPLLDAEKDIEEDEQPRPTRRVEISSMAVTVIRAS